MQFFRNFVWDHFFRDLIIVFRNYIEAIPFIRQHRLWDGLLKTKWIAFLIVGGLLLMGFEIYQIFSSRFMAVNVNGDDPTVSYGILEQIGGAFSDTSALFSGGYKYIVLLLFEVLVFHFVRRTNEIITGQKESVSFSQFLQAVKRLIIITFRNFVFELIALIVWSIIAGILGLDVIQVIGKLIIQAFFIGFTLVDNYHEIQQLTIEESSEKVKNYPGVAIGLGLVFNLVLLLPILGPIAAPILGGVTASRSLYDIQQLEDETI